MIDRQKILLRRVHSCCFCGPGEVGDGERYQEIVRQGHTKGLKRTVSILQCFISRALYLYSPELFFFLVPL